MNNIQMEHGGRDLHSFHVTAELSESSEYQVFVDAYRAWYGRQPQTCEIEALFGAYLRSGQLPAFVRHFTRRYLADHPEQLAARTARYQASQKADIVALLLIAAMVFGALILR